MCSCKKNDTSNGTAASLEAVRLEGNRANVTFRVIYIYIGWNGTLERFGSSLTAARLAAVPLIVPQ